MYLADTLSRAPVEEGQTCSLAKELEKVDHQQSLPIGNPRWIQLKEASVDDAVLTALRTVIEQG